MSRVRFAVAILLLGMFSGGSVGATQFDGDRSACRADSLVSLAGVEACNKVLQGRGQRRMPNEVRAKQVMFYQPWYGKSKAGLTAAAEATLVGVYHPHRHVEEYRFSIPMDWSDDPFKDRSWRARLQSFNIIDPLLLEYEGTGDSRYLSAALEIVLDWNRHHVEEGLASSLAWADGPTGIRSAKIGWLYSQLVSQKDWQYSEREINSLRELALLHIGKVVSGEIELRMTNHGLFQVNGLMVLCSAFEFAEICDDVDEFVRVNLPSILRAQYSAAGVHLEHSPNYHSFATSKLAFFEESGLYEEFPIIRETRARALEVMYWLVDPSGNMWAIGDTFATAPRDAVIAQGDACELVGRLDRKCVQVWSQDGYVSIRSPADVPVEDASGLFFQASFHSNVHKHLDDLSFEWFERGERILIDSGPIGYRVSKMRRYVLSTRAHNTIEIDNENFSRNNDYAYGGAVKGVENYGTHVEVRGEVVHPDLGALHSRELYYQPGSWLAVRDTVDSVSARKFVQWFHLAPSAEFVSRADGEVRFRTGKGEVIFRGDHGCPSTLVKGDYEPRIQGWYSPSSGTVEPNYALGFVCMMGEDGVRTVTTVISLDETAQEFAADVLSDIFDSSTTP